MNKRTGDEEEAGDGVARGSELCVNEALHVAFVSVIFVIFVILATRVGETDTVLVTFDDGIVPKVGDALAGCELPPAQALVDGHGAHVPDEPTQ